MIIDCNNKDKNKDFSKKTKYVTGAKNFGRSGVENRNNYNLTNIKNPAIAEIENPFTITGFLTAIIDELNNLSKKVEFLEKNLISQHYGNFIVKEENSRNDES